MKSGSGIYAGVFVRGPGKTTVLVFDEAKELPMWKFPGGGGQYLLKENRWEAPEETARRELFEETGLTAKTLKPIEKVNKGSHWWYLFEAVVDNFDGLLRRGNDGEYVAKFAEAQLWGMQNFLKPHKEVLREFHFI